jgi:hypothetical protein
VPVPSSELVLVVVDVPTPALTPVPVVVVEVLTPAPVVPVVVSCVVVCAKLVLNARALTAPAANILINLFCFMFVLLFG